MLRLLKGTLITFEGGEGAGKTTLMDEVARQLASEGYCVVKTREPGGTHLGEHIRSLLLDKTAHPMSAYAELALFLAARAQHLEEVILPALEARKIVLCDRFNDSTIAYQGVARGLGKEQVTQMCEFICHKTVADLTLYLDLDPAIGLSRALSRRQEHKDRIELEALAFHKKVREAFLEMHVQHPQRFRLLDASLPAPVVYAEAMHLIQTLLKQQP